MTESMIGETPRERLADKIRGVLWCARQVSIHQPYTAPDPVTSFSIDELALIYAALSEKP